MKIALVERNPGVFVISPHGDVDMSTSPELRNQLIPLFEKHPSHLVVDLSGVPYIDSSGIATLVEALQLSRKGSTRLTLAGANRTVESVFELAYLKQVFEMVPGVEELFGSRESA